jgi:hypothetical protein
MAGQLVECQVCKTVTKSELKGSTLISFITFWFFMMIPGIIYMIWRRGGIGVCANCRSPLVIPCVKKEKSREIIHLNSGSKMVAHDPFAFNAGKKIQLDNHGVEQKQCRFCKENIRFDAIKCKHCGSMLESNEN